MRLQNNILSFLLLGLISCNSTDSVFTDETYQDTIKQNIGGFLIREIHHYDDFHSYNYDIEYLFTVSEHVFLPPPKVKSAVIRLKRNSIKNLPCNEAFFVEVVKAAFNLRRKMLRNSLKAICENLHEKYAEKRPEQLSVDDFIELTTIIENLKKN